MLFRSLTGGGAVVKKAKAKAEEEEETVGGKGMHLTEEMLDKVMAQLAVEQGPELASSIQRIDVQKLVAEAGINKAFLQGKQGLMGKGTKDMACGILLLCDGLKLTRSLTSSHKFWSTQPVPKLGTRESASSALRVLWLTTRCSGGGNSRRSSRSQQARRGDST